MSNRQHRRPSFAALWLIVVVLLPVSYVRAGQDPGPAVPGAGEPAGSEAGADRSELSPELRMVLRKLEEANEKLKDIRARVTYDRAIPLLDEKQRSKGTLTYKKPGLIALKLGKPRNEEVYTNGKTWWIVSHDDKQVEIYEAAAEGQASLEAAFLDFGYGRGPDKLLKEYRVELLGKEAHEDKEGKETIYKLKFIPRPREDRPARYAAIEVEVSDRLWLPHVLVLHESGGEIVHTYALSNIRVNTGVKDKTFDYTPRRGYSVWHPQEL